MVRAPVASELLILCACSSLGVKFSSGASIRILLNFLQSWQLRSLIKFKGCCNKKRVRVLLVKEWPFLIKLLLKSGNTDSHAPSGSLHDWLPPSLRHVWLSLLFYCPYECCSSQSLTRAWDILFGAEKWVSDTVEKDCNADMGRVVQTMVACCGNGA